MAPEPSKHEENQEQGSSLLYLHDPDILVIPIVHVTQVKVLILQLGFGSLTQVLQQRSRAAESEKLSEASRIFNFEQ